MDSFDHLHLEDCIAQCNNNDECNFYTYEKTHDHCILYEDCNQTLECATCASGPKNCAMGVRYGEDANGAWGHGGEVTK